MIAATTARKRRRARLRATAMPTLRLAVKPTRTQSPISSPAVRERRAASAEGATETGSRRKTWRMRPGATHLRPAPATLRNSARRLRCGSAPGRAGDIRARRRAACVPSSGARREPCVRRRSPNGRGSHDGACGRSCWVDKCASRHGLRLRLSFETGALYTRALLVSQRRDAWRAAALAFQAALPDRHAGEAEPHFEATRAARTTPTTPRVRPRRRQGLMGIEPGHSSRRGAFTARRVLPLAALAAAIIAVFALRLDRYLSFEQLAAHREWLLAEVGRLGPLAPPLFALVYAAATGLSIPGATVLTLTAGFLFGTLAGTATV